MNNNTIISAPVNYHSCIKTGCSRKRQSSSVNRGHICQYHCMIVMFNICVFLYFLMISAHSALFLSNYFCFILLTGNRGDTSSRRSPVLYTHTHTHTQTHTHTHAYTHFFTQSWVPKDLQCVCVCLCVCDNESCWLAAVIGYLCGLWRWPSVWCQLDARQTAHTVFMCVCVCVCVCVRES